MPWTIKAAKQRYRIADEPMQPMELLSVQKLLGDEERGDMSQPVLASLLGMSERQLRKYQHGETRIPTLVAREARRLRGMREGAR